jgi:hypothetical protein
METKRYYRDRIDNGPSPLPDVIEAEKLVFLAIAVQIGN